MTKTLVTADGIEIKAGLVVALWGTDYVWGVVETIEGEDIGVREWSGADVKTGKPSRRVDLWMAWQLCADENDVKVWEEKDHAKRMALYAEIVAAGPVEGSYIEYGPVGGAQ